MLYQLCHRHSASECPVVFAAWKGFVSPLRNKPTLSSCTTGSHCLWWTVEAGDEITALGYLPPYVATRTEAMQVRQVVIS